MFRVTTLAEIVRETVALCFIDNVPRLGASLAFYVILSLAPMLVITIAIVALAYGREAAQSNLLLEVRRWIGPDGAIVVNGLFKSASKPSAGDVTIVFGFAILTFGASSAVVELREALNAIWNCAAVSAPSIIGNVGLMLRERLYSLAILTSFGCIFLLSLFLHSVASGIGLFDETRRMFPLITLHLMRTASSWLTAAAVFSAIYKILPAVKLKWSDVIISAAATSLLFTIGQQAIGFYLGKLSLNSTYGAAGSLVALLVWVYYSAQILFFGAEVTKVYAKTYGSMSSFSIQSGVGSQMPHASSASTAGVYKTSTNGETEV